eukprot:CAMPEP_0179179748 /NCGR_PEP_ID=MMETSP0796-20121207/88963_1 /TAXON_ID=73915 /ORGANISM="Pyrodinium bahamense, Strain pbaha01" /LENGTH=342 /DNA_ID=CAMNT_0020883415 /DNA_START=28 /DNA_END=1052 /DNA_ORIENTATION=-
MECGTWQWTPLPALGASILPWGGYGSSCRTAAAAAAEACATASGARAAPWGPWLCQLGSSGEAATAVACTDACAVPAELAAGAMPPALPLSAPAAPTAAALNPTAVAAAHAPSPASCPMPEAFRAGTGAGTSRGVGAGAGGLRRVLCYGDSLTAGFCAGGRVFRPYGWALAEALATVGAGTECEVSICGHSGHLAAEMVANLDGERVQDFAMRHGKGLRRILEEQGHEGRPELAIIMAGTNDLGVQRPPSAIFEDICRLHTACHAHGIRTVALAPPPAPATLHTPWELARWQLKGLLASWAASCPLVAACLDPGDLVPATAASGAWDPDLLHLSPLGSELLG